MPRAPDSAANIYSVKCKNSSSSEVGEEKSFSRKGKAIIGLSHIGWVWEWNCGICIIPYGLI
jgi:hypothetical protein